MFERTDMVGVVLWFVAQVSVKDVRPQIQAQYDRWSKAYMANDVDTLLSILSPDYVLTNVQKETTSYKVYKAYLELRRKTPRDTTVYKTRIKSLTLHGLTADVDSIEDMTTIKPKPGPRTLLKSVHTHEYLDVWTFDGKVWLLTSTKTLKESTVTK